VSVLILLIGIAAFLVLSILYFTSAPPAQVANTLRLVGPAILVLVGAIFSFAGRISIGAPLIMMAVAWYGRQRRLGSSRRTGGQKSTVRSAWLEMELDHDSGDMDGVVLVGRFEGRRLFDMSDQEVRELAADLSDDRESAQLLEAYLDRRMPGWRDDAETHPGAGHGGAYSAGAMTQEEAYKVLGLEPGASAVEIRKAHRGLMQRVHPDLGGNAFLAQRVNEARDVLLRDHAD
jgi:hypothetical protein